MVTMTNLNIYSYLMLVVFSVGYANAQNLFDKCEYQQKASVGAEFLIKCTTLIDSDIKTEWKLLQPRQPITNNNLNFEISEQGLRIKNVDATLQKAQFRIALIEKDTEKTLDARIITLSVFKHPEITMPKQIDVELDQNITLNCHADGIPKPTITWYNQKSKTLQSSLNGKLEIEIASESDLGLYKCKAQNEAGSRTESILVKLVNDTQTRQIHPFEIESVRIANVTVNSATFQMQAPKEGPEVSSIFGSYSIIGEKSEEKSFTWKMLDKDSTYQIGNLQAGAAYRFQFAAISSQGVHGPWYHKAVDVFLLPPKPQLIVQTADQTIIKLEWLYPFSIGDANNIDVFEIKSSKVQLYGLKKSWGDPEFSMYLILPATSTYSFLRDKNTSKYQKYEIRAHNKGGYSEWDSLYIPPFKI